MFEGVGRRRDQAEGAMVSIGENSLNGYERNCLFRNNGDGTFTDVAHVNQADRIEDGRGVAMLDYDGDGREDVLIRNYRMPAQLLHGVGPTGHWLEVKLVGTVSNRDAVGARVVAVTGDRRQLRVPSAGSAYLSNGSLVQHFGLGDATTVDRLEITWPSGRVDVVRDLAADRRIVVTEGGRVAGTGARGK
jgi:enediyne biosynthesis protein E4